MDSDNEVAEGGFLTREHCGRGSFMDPSSRDWIRRGLFGLVGLPRGWDMTHHVTVCADWVE